MNRTITADRDLSKLRALQNRVWRRQTGWTGHFMVAAFSLIAFVVLIAVGKSNSVGVWMMLAFAILYGCWPLLSYMRTMQKAEKGFLEGPETNTFVFTDAGLGLAGEIGNMELFWNGLTAFLEYPEGDVLEFQKKLRFLFPSPIIDDEIRTFLREHLARNLSTASAVQASQPKVIDY